MPKKPTSRTAAAAARGLKIVNFEFRQEIYDTIARVRDHLRASGQRSPSLTEAMELLVEKGAEVVLGKEDGI